MWSQVNNGDQMMRSGKKANLAALDTGERMQSSAFKSKTAQREKAQNLHVPGAGDALRACAQAEP